MTHRILVSITSLLVAIAATVGSGFDVRTAAASDTAASDSATVLPDASSTLSGGLCGMGAPTVAGIVGHYELSPNMTTVQQSLSQPLDCDAYGQLCTVLDDPADAEDYVCGVWGGLAANDSPSVLFDNAVATIQSHRGACTPDYEDCEDICGQYDVLSCKGTFWQGNCWALASCDFFEISYIPFFEDVLGPE